MSTCLTWVVLMWVVLMGLFQEPPASAQEPAPGGLTVNSSAVVTPALDGPALEPALLEPALLEPPLLDAPPLDAPPLEPVVDRLLDRLEQSATDLRSFTAGVRYEVIDELLGRSEIRSGRLIYRVQEEGRRFAILFDQFTVRNEGQAGGRREARRQHYVFDGQWLAEIDHDSRQFIKHQIVAPGKTLDPLKLGEGPFPLPVGQPKAEVLARFEVTAQDELPEGPLASLRERHKLQGLRLVPRKGTEEADEYARVDLFYDLETLLPVGIHVLQTNGDVKIVRLSDPTRNAPLYPADEAALRIDEPDPSLWAISIVPWKDRR